jgi:hypothetical protein
VRRGIDVGHSRQRTERGGGCGREPANGWRWTGSSPTGWVMGGRLRGGGAGGEEAGQGGGGGGEAAVSAAWSGGWRVLQI